jgi:hypothetical protein
MHQASEFVAQLYFGSGCCDAARKMPQLLSDFAPT